MKTFLWLSIALLISGFQPVVAGSSQSAQPFPESLEHLRPNIVFIMADDLGPGDLSYHQDAVSSFPGKNTTSRPAIDGLARSGINNYRSYAPWGIWGTFLENPIKPGQTSLGTSA